MVIEPHDLLLCLQSSAPTTELILQWLWQKPTLGVDYIDIVLFRGNCYSKEPKSVTAFDLFTFFCADFIQSEASWKLSSTSDWLMSAWKNVSYLKEVNFLGSLL